jgi:hypothetical protein
MLSNATFVHLGGGGDILVFIRKNLQEWFTLACENNK